MLVLVIAFLKGLSRHGKHVMPDILTGVYYVLTSPLYWEIKFNGRNSVLIEFLPRQCKRFEGTSSIRKSALTSRPGFFAAVFSNQS